MAGGQYHPPDFEHPGIPTTNYQMIEVMDLYIL